MKECWKKTLLWEKILAVVVVPLILVYKFLRDRIFYWLWWNRREYENGKRRLEEAKRQMAEINAEADKVLRKNCGPSG